MARQATPVILLTLLLLSSYASSAPSSAQTSEGPSVTSVRSQKTAISTETPAISTAPDITTAPGTSLQPTVTATPPIITTCGHNIELPIAGLSVLDVDQVIVNFTGAVTANCSWIVRPFNASANNYFAFYVNNVMPSSCKQNTTLSFFDMEPSSGNLSYVGNWCRSTYASVTGRQGYPTLITFKSQNISELNPTNTLFYYGSYIMPERQCPDSIMELQAGYNRSSFHVSRFLVWLPNGMLCQWRITGPEKGVVNLKLYSFFQFDRNCTPGDNYFLIKDVGRPRMQEHLRVDLCDGGTVFTHKSVSGELLLTFHSGDVGGAPDFTITYWADDIDHLCPTPTAYLRAQQGEVGVFKGVNHAVGNLSERHCSWKIIAYDDREVVKLLNISNFDYLADCAVNDSLQIQGHSKPIGMCQSDVFPVWSQSYSTTVHFHSEANSPRREFLIYYTSVPKGTCQGNSVWLWASRETNTLAESASLGNDTDETDCRWTIKAVAGYEVQGVVPVPPGATWSCSMPWLTVNDDFHPSSVPPCRSTNTALIYTSRTRTLYVRFNRKPGVIDDSVRNFTMNYRLVDSSTGAAGRAALSVEVLAVLVIAWSVFLI